jgi:type I restriction enzyme S subunit
LTESRWAIPAEWKWLALSDISQIIGGGTPPASDETNFAESGIPWITPADLTGYLGTYIERGARDLSEKGFNGSSARILPPRSVLFSSRAPIGYCVVAKNEITTNQGFKSLIPNAEQSSEFLRYYLLSAKDYAESVASGTTFKELSGSRMATLAVPVPPLAEQRRIVAKLDSLTGRVARARAELSGIPRLIKKYREAVLAAAFGGVLTKDWRQSNGFQNPHMTTLGTQVSDISYGTAKKCHADGNGVPVLRIPNISAGTINLSDLKYAELEEKELAKLRLHDGDILIVRSNGSVDLVGKPALVEDAAVGLAYAGYLIRLRPKKETALPRFLRVMLQAPQVRKIIETNARSTSGVHNINGKELAALEVPQPTTREQVEIVRRVETAFAWLDRVAEEYAEASRLLPRFEQAIFAKAFRGALVEQEPGDKPVAANGGHALEEGATFPKSKEHKPRSAIRLQTNRSAMSRSRTDIDVKGKPYLASKVKEVGGKTSIEQLYRTADLSLIDFYKQLSDEFDRRWLRKTGGLVEAA